MTSLLQQCGIPPKHVGNVDLDYVRRGEGKGVHPEMKIYGMKYYEVTHMDIDNVMESKEL